MGRQHHIFQTRIGRAALHADNEVSLHHDVTRDKTVRCSEQEAIELALFNTKGIEQRHECGSTNEISCLVEFKIGLPILNRSLDLLSRSAMHQTVPDIKQVFLHQRRDLKPS